MLCVVIEMAKQSSKSGKEKAGSRNEFMSLGAAVGSVAFYNANQGKVARRATMLTSFLVCAMAAWAAANWLPSTQIFDEHIASTETESVLRPGEKSTLIVCLYVAIVLIWAIGSRMGLCQKQHAEDKPGGAFGTFFRALPLFGIVILWLAAILIPTNAFGLDQTAAKDLRLTMQSTVVPGILLVLGCWSSFRAVNWPRFAEFLISVETEMAKVSWPQKRELVLSSIVVIVMIFLLAGVLFFYDIIWQAILQWFGVKMF